MTSSIMTEVRRKRLERGLKQREVAAALGVSTMTVKRWEKNTQPLPAFKNMLEQYWAQNPIKEEL